MFRSNIDGLAKVLNQLDRRLKKVETSTPRIKGGNNTNVSQVGNTFTINSTGEGGGGGGTAVLDVPWKSYIYTTPDTDPPQKFVRNKGGLLNGLPPSNVDDDLLQVSEDKTYIVYLEATMTGSQVSNISLKAILKGNEPNLEYQFVKDAPPSTFRHFLGVVHDQKITANYLKSNLKIKPMIAYRDQDGVDSYANYWTWDIYPI